MVNNQIRSPLQAIVQKACNSQDRLPQKIQEVSSLRRATIS